MGNLYSLDTNYVKSSIFDNSYQQVYYKGINE